MRCVDCGDEIDPALASERANRISEGGVLCEPCRKDRMLADTMDAGCCGDAKEARAVTSQC